MLPRSDPVMSHITSNIAELKGSVDFGIITIREDEFEAILERLLTEQIVVGRERYAMSPREQRSMQ